MLDFFTIFSKGGIVLWYIQNTNNAITSSINALIKTVILQERGGTAPFMHDTYALRYHMDNEFDLVFVVGYQKILQLSYVDKLLTSLALEFRDKYKDDLMDKNVSRDFSDFTPIYTTLLNEIEEDSREELKRGKQMRSFGQSSKSKKTVASLIVPPSSAAKNETDKVETGKKSKGKGGKVSGANNSPQDRKNGRNKEPVTEAPNESGEIDTDTIQKNREKFMSKMAGGKKPKAKPAADDSPTDSPVSGKKKGKEARKWHLGGTQKDAAELDYSSPADPSVNGTRGESNLTASEEAELCGLRGTLKGDLGDIEVESESEESEEEEEEQVETLDTKRKKPDQQQQPKKSGVLGLLRNLVGGAGGPLTRADIEPILDQMRDRLVAKNVAVEIAHRLCESVAERLLGTQLGTFERIASRVRGVMEEACTQLLSSKRRLDVLRDIMETKKTGRPYVIVFCGVNGVGKSTNLAKISFWLMEKDFRVLIAACDTFRAGAVEQLRTHVSKLNFIHPPERHHGQRMVELYEKGYGKDAATIAMSAINSARDHHFDVVLVDTAGRMQDNEPLMRSLAKLIVVNQPDLVLFVGEALVGNEAVDQLVKFNQALSDHSQTENPHTIDGIVLTKFDTIDDKVGAAISMTYISGQPIVFVGTGQTYADLRQLSSSAVVKALMK